MEYTLQKRLVSSGDTPADGALTGRDARRPVRER